MKIPISNALFDGKFNANSKTWPDINVTASKRYRDLFSNDVSDAYVQKHLNDWLAHDLALVKVNEYLHEMNEELCRPANRNIESHDNTESMVDRLSRMKSYMIIWRRCQVQKKRTNGKIS